jgi:hypothetical protein
LAVLTRLVLIKEIMDNKDQALTEYSDRFRDIGALTAEMMAAAEDPVGTAGELTETAIKLIVLPQILP